ncbi:MAG TPA: hydroxymethylbilane synthase [Burkholderiales bacterium]|nr:hydroxymethylbilane synthase [Burkholderiales bacterium]
MKSPDRIVIASRVSRLAMWQAEHVRDALTALYPACRVEVLGMTTRGDEILDRSLAKIGGKGLFVKELENALEDGRADIAVHSAKDVPMDLPAGFALAAILAREDPRDALVSNDYARLADLPAGAIVGTSSLRREAQLRCRFPALEVRPLRGSLDTRLAKLDRGEYAAIVLAVAGLKRLGLESRIRGVLEPEESLPAVGQGALAIECREGRPELVAALAPLHDGVTAACVRAERAVSRALGGSCTVPLAAHAEVLDGAVQLRGLVASPDGQRVARAEVRGEAFAPERAGEALAAALRAQGADAILAELA